MAADNVVRSLYDRLDALLSDNSDALKEVSETCSDLLDKLEPLIKFEKNWEEKKDGIGKELLIQITDAIEDAEDVISKYVVRQNINEVKQELDDIKEFITEITSSITELYEMTGSISSERSRKEREEEQERLKQLRRNVEEDDVVGLKKLTEDLLKQLVRRSGKLQVVSITGMGGSGKTTLAKKIYNHSRIKKHFQCRAWLPVSNQQEEVKLEIRTISDLSWEGNIDESFSKFSKEKRFFIVIDGLWSTNVLDQIKNVVSKDSNGSRILITTRVEKVGLQADISPHVMRLLDMEQSWELFTRKVFQGEKFPPELAALGREIVERCCGLPAAVSVVAALAACKEKTIRMWLKLLEDIEWHITHDKADVLDVLALSYNDLPWTSKQCFLYLGVFPKDFKIPVRQLIQLWIAEGFVQHTDEAEGHLEKLVDQSLVKVLSRRTDGGIKTCCVHNLNRLLCLSECKKNKFLELRTDTKFFSRSKPRRLSLHCEIPLYIRSNPPDDSSVHSLFCFGSYISDWDWLYKSFSLIRILNLSGVNIKAIPDSIKELILLKYVKVESEDLPKISPCIGNILNLQTVDLRYSTRYRLPVESKLRYRTHDLLPVGIWKLRKLQHVYVSETRCLTNLHYIDSSQLLENLQSLSWVALDENTAQFFDKEVFHNITKLGLSYNPYIRYICNPIEALSNLSKLRNLRRLKISGTCELPKSPQSFPPNLTKITLKNIKFLNCNTTPTLENLPELQILKLLRSVYPIDDKELGFICSANGFPNLKVLQLSKLHIPEWKLEEGAMQKLEHLIIKKCYKLSVLPDQLWRLNGLREVHALEPSQTLAENLGRVQVKDNCKLVVDRQREL